MPPWRLFRKSAQLDIDDGVTVDISPASFGHSALGTNDGHGYSTNPLTGEPYVAEPVKRGDFTRVLAEFWADGPKSETPPDTGTFIANNVAQHPLSQHKLFGEGPALDPLSWDVHTYVALNGALHDAAIAAWELKRVYTTARPITLIRYMGGHGQRSDPGQASYDPEGLPLIDGLIEVITAEARRREAGTRTSAVTWARSLCAPGGASRATACTTSVAWDGSGRLSGLLTSGAPSSRPHFLGTSRVTAHSAALPPRCSPASPEATSSPVGRPRSPATQATWYSNTDRRPRSSCNGQPTSMRPIKPGSPGFGEAFTFHKTTSMGVASAPASVLARWNAPRHKLVGEVFPYREGCAAISPPRPPSLDGLLKW